MLEIPREALTSWAAGKPTIKALYVFGSYARGEAQPQSDLDLAFEFTDVDDADAELIENAQAWKVELTQLTGVEVKDLYHSTATAARSGPALLIFERNAGPCRRPPEFKGR